MTYPLKHHAGVKCSVSSMRTNLLSKLSCWSQLDEILHYLKSSEKSHKQTILLQQAESLGNINSVCKQKYSPEIIVRAFEYFARS